MSRIRVGDVCLDLAQGRPVLVVEDPEQDAGEWSRRNDYNLSENYANGRFDMSPSDAVYDVVYVSNARSEPSKTYAFPESRLLRLEPELATDDERRVQWRLRRRTLDLLFDAAIADPDEALEAAERLARLAFTSPLVDAALEDARARHFGTGGDPDGE